MRISKLSMWALRRASINLKSRGLSSGATRFCLLRSETSYLENYNAGFIESQGKEFDALVNSTKFYSKSSSLKPYMDVRTFSSQAGARSSVEQDDASMGEFGELETPHDAVEKDASRDDGDYESISESDLSEGESRENEFETLGTDTDVGEKESHKSKDISPMTKAIFAAHASPVSEVLGKWVEEGNEITQEEVSSTMIYLRRRRMFSMALQLSEWLETSNHVEMNEKYYAWRVDLIAKVRGFYEAQDYIQQIPESFRSETVYRPLLAKCVSMSDTRKAEVVFEQMKKLFPVTCFSCNKLLLLYKRVDRKKIADVLLLMEKENIEPSIFTYQILVDMKRHFKDVTGIEQIIEIMKSKGVEPDMKIQASLAQCYAATGLKDKAEAILKEIERGDKPKDVCSVYCLLLPMYASLGREDEVQRIWKVCESDPWPEECMATIVAWGQLNRIEEAEAVFEVLLKKLQRPSSKNYAVLLNVYANHKMLAKGKDLVRRMDEQGITVLPVVWDALIRLHAGAGEVEEADSILEKAIEQRRGKPFITSYLAILDLYSERGDIHNAEKIFLKMRKAGYGSQIRPYRLLLNAYVKAKTPAYGFNERLRAGKVVPTKTIASMLAQQDDALTRKSEVDWLVA